MKPTQMNIEPQEPLGAGEAAGASCGLPPGGLSAALLRTEDLADLISGFMAEARAFVPVDGVRYSNAAHAIDIRAGTPGRHSCGYTLRMRELTLGQVTFTRARRFGAAELMALELLLVELLLPLLAALRRRALSALAGGERRTAETPSSGPARRSPAPALEAGGLSLVPLEEAEPGPGLLRPVRPRADRVQVERDRLRRLHPEELADPLLHWGAFGLGTSRGEKG